MRWNTLALGLAACSGDDGQSASASTTVNAKPLFILSKDEAFLIVYEDKLWELQNHARCNFMDGKVSDAEMTDIQGYLKDESLGLADKECAKGQFSLLVGAGAKNKACWDQPTGTGRTGITKLYMDLMLKLDQMPMGMCTGKPLDGPNVMPIKDQPKPPTRNAAGSGG